MRIHVTNTVCCNGGDAAILMGVETLLKKRFGDELVLSIADSAPEIVASFYPHLETMPLAFDRISVRYKGSWKRPFRPLAIGRFWTGAYLLAHKWEGLANHLLTHEERAGLQVLKNADAVLSTGGTYLTQNY